MSGKASEYWHLVEENKRLSNSLKVIMDYVGSSSDLSSLHILEICLKTLNNTAIYKPLSE